MSISINKKKVSLERAIQVVNDHNTRVTSLNIDIPGPEDRGEMTNRGFEIPQAIISSLSHKMDVSNAGVAKLALSDCRTLNGKSVYIFMLSPHARGWSKIVFKVLQKLL